MKFRYDIGALRAISVLVVVLFHFGVPGFSGGFIGVDVFFVISGFLMTKIIFSGLDRGNFHFLKFYEKRGNRIIPALLFMLLFVWIVSTIFMFTADIRLNNKYIVLSAAFISNIYYWLYSGYFDPSSQSNILLHTWSLSVEWQFYMIYPLLLYPLRKKSTKVRSVFLIILAVLSFLLMMVVTKDYNNFSFYMFPTRAWEMIAGGIAALLASNEKHRSSNIKKIIAVLSYAGIFASTFMIAENDLWPSVFTFFPVIFTFLVLLLELEFRFIKNPVIQFFGNISYSLYLWHWPVKIIYEYYGLTGAFYTVQMLGISLAMAMLSYHLIEKKEIFRLPKIYITVALILAGFAAYTFIRPHNILVSNLSVFKGSNSALANVQQTYFLDQWEKQANSCGCYIDTKKSFSDYNVQKCLKISNDKDNILLVGDSHAAMFSSAFRSYFKEFNILEANASYTFPLYEARGRKEGSRLMNYVYGDFLPKHAGQIRAVFISAHWPMYHNRALGYGKEEVIPALIKTIEYLQSLHIPVYVIGQTENYKIPYPRVLLLSQFTGMPQNNFISPEGKEINTALKYKLGSGKYIDIYNKIPTRFVSKNNMPYNFDGNHYTELGAFQAVKLIGDHYKLSTSSWQKQP